MKKKNIFKTTFALSSAALLYPNIAICNSNKSFGITKTPRKFKVSNKYEFEQTKEITQLWVPLPKDEDYHKVVSFYYSEIIVKH